MNFKSKIFLITGGTGSFGTEMVKKLLTTDVAEIRILSRDEKKQHDMRFHFKSSKIKFYIGDVRDYDSLRDAFNGVDFVFHAAALKQVPSAEFFPYEAVKTNIVGTNNVINISISSGVEKVICLSTDKAAYPINAMGISKAMAEKVAFSKARNLVDSRTKIIVTRYGNVLSSRGSVVPLFLSQIKNKVDLTVTHPSMSRFIMTLEDAINLVIKAIEVGNTGDLFVYKASAAKIIDIAECLLKINNSNSKIKITGPRHSEKMYETLLTIEENANAIDLGDYFLVPLDNRTSNYDDYIYMGNAQLFSKTDFNSENTIQLKGTQLELILQKNQTFPKSDF